MQYSSVLSAAKGLWEDAANCRDPHLNGTSITILNPTPVSREAMEPLEKEIEEVVPRRDAWGFKKMRPFWRFTNVMFLQEVYQKVGTLEKMKADSRTHCPPLDQFNYMDRLFRGGLHRDLDLIGWFVRRMQSKMARCPYYWLPYFTPDKAFPEARGSKFRPKYRTASGFFCMAALSFYPESDGTVVTTLITRNWASSRWFTSTNGICYLIRALEKELPKWKFPVLKVMAPVAQRDLSKKTLWGLAHAADQILKDGEWQA